MDTENLRGPEYARQVVAAVAANWPSHRPPLSSVSLYVRADKTELWRLWAESAFPTLTLRVRGVQRFSANNSKNSADLAIAADAVSDLVMGLAKDVAVVSNDSDFGALFVKVRELAREANAETAPFLWIHPPEGGALSPEIDEFIPPVFRWNLAATLMAPTAPEPAQSVGRPTPELLPHANRRALPAGSANDNVTNEAMAEELIRRLPPGRFRAVNAQEIISKRWPKHPAAGDTAQFGQFLSKEIWPILQKRGVTMPRKSSPRTYEISQAAKESTAGPPSPRPSPAPTPPRQTVAEPTVAEPTVAEPTVAEPTVAEPTAAEPTAAEPTVAEPTAAEPTVAELAASIAAGITEDIFKAAQAQAALKMDRPQHPAASYTAPQFGVWFAKQLWPVMERHGVTIAKEKPRLYEMTPDARHRLTSLA